MMTRVPSLPRRRQEGVALLEVLIAVLLLAIGLLGTVGLQARAYSALSEAGLRAEATIAAERLMGTMTTDATNLTAYRLAAGGTPGPRLASWHTLTQQNIPGAVVTVVVVTPTVANAPNDVTITISWQRQANAMTNQHILRAFI
jgi:type IV pilus assembly protein PilV